jgi:hypothetical protein
MDKTRLFQFLSNENSTVLLDVLSAAYDEMKYDQREAVFGRYVEALPPAPVDGEVLLDEVERFRQDSYAEVYYAPFDINSKNWRYVPEETKEWFDQLGDLLQGSAQLTAQGNHLHAAACFRVLYELIGAMESGEEVVFGDEIGSWMVPGDEKEFIAAYMASLAATASPEEFTAAALPLIRRDTWQGFVTHAYTSATRAASEAQRAHLEAEVRRQNIRTGQEG